MTLTITARRTGLLPTRAADGAHRLSAELDWLVEGDDLEIQAVEALLPALVCERVGQALLLRFGNAVGIFDGGPLGHLVVHSDKWAERHFDEMLAEITRRIALLPFAAGTGAHLPYDRSISSEPYVLYHAFVYLRYLCSRTAAAEDRLTPALRLILAEPHRRFERVARTTPLHAVQRVEPRSLSRMFSSAASLTRAPRMTHLPLARSLRGHLPTQLEETRPDSTVDTPENRFIKAFLGQAMGIIDAMREVATRRGEDPFSRRILRDCEAMAHELLPLRRHPVWDDVSAMHHLPANSQVLQRRRGYREVFRHFARLRLGARLPLSRDTSRRLLELKDIAELYEMWSFFAIEAQVTAALGSRPLVADVAAVDEFGAHLGWGLRLAWAGGIELFYNLPYSRTNRAGNHSYSLPLRPDIVLRVPTGRSAGDHIFDAKFKVRRLADAMQTADAVDETEQAAERRGVFKHADLYKMHTYRDAIAGARSVWILYPGSEFLFFDEAAGRIASAEKLDASANGVGAIPLAPAGSAEAASIVLRRLLPR